MAEPEEEVGTTNPPPASNWQQRKDQIAQVRDSLVPGFEEASVRNVNPPPPREKRFTETYKATFLQTGIFGNAYNDYRPSREFIADEDFKVETVMRPQDKPYTAIFLMAKNLEQAQEIQEWVDNQRSMQEAIAARPWAAGFSALLSPDMIATLPIDIASLGYSKYIQLPLLYRGIKGVNKAMRIDEVARLGLGTRKILEEAYHGGQMGALNAFATEKIVENINPLYEGDDAAKHMFFGGLVGSMIGAGVGVMQAKKLSKLKQDFLDNYDINNANDLKPDTRAPVSPQPGEVGPQNPFTQNYINTKDLGLRMQAPKKAAPFTPEQLKTLAENLKKKVTVDDVPLRQEAYERLRDRFKILGESFVDNLGLPPILKKVASMVTAPWRNMSANNRLISSQFGSARLYAASMARNVIEFIGTREDLAMPRAAQNRIEDIMNQAMDLQIQLHNLYLQANKIEKGPYSAEKLAWGTRIVEETQFYEDVGTHLLYVGTREEAQRGVSNEVSQAAKLLHEELYKPFGQVLKDYNIIPKDAKTSDVLNYLNRLWDNEKISNDPKGFQKFLADYYSQINQQLQSILPNYRQERRFASQIKRNENRWRKAAQEIEALKQKVGQPIKDKIADLQAKLSDAEKRTETRFDKMRQTIINKYEKLRNNPKKKAPDIKTTKKLLREQVKEARAARDTAQKKFSSMEKDVDVKIQKARAERDAKIKKIEQGKMDDVIEERFIEANQENMVGAILGLEETQAEAMAETLFQDIDENVMKSFRDDFISETRTEYRNQIESLYEDKQIIRLERDEMMVENKRIMDKDLTEATNLLSEESLDTGKLSQEEKIKKLIDARENLELKTVDIKEKNALVKIFEDFIEKKNKALEPQNRLDSLYKKYGIEGHDALVDKQSQYMVARRLDEIGQSQAAKNLRKSADKTYREALKKVAPGNDAQIKFIIDDLEAAFEKAAERAEMMIPEEMRSSKTGLPYATWDEALEPGRAAKLAEKTYWTLLGQEDEVIFNPMLDVLKGTGSAKVFKPRGIKMPDNYKGIENWVQRDARVLANNFAGGIAPAIALTESMFELNQLPIIQATVKRMQVLNKSVGPKKAVTLPSEMQHFTEIPAVLGSMMREEFRMLSEGLTGKELTKLQSAYRQAEKDMTDLDKIIKGVMGNGMSVNSQNAADFVDLINSWVSTVTNNNIAISMMGDVASGALVYGFKDYINKGLIPLLNSKELLALSKQELNVMNLATKVAQGTVQKNRISGRQQSLKNTNVGRFVSNVANRIGNYTGANAIQDFAETVNGVLAKSNILEMAVLAAEGKLDKRALVHLRQFAMTDEKLSSIYRMYKRHGWSKEQMRGIDPAKLGNLTADELEGFSHYVNYVNDVVRTINARPGAGSLPNFAYTPYGKSVTFLKKWFFAATNDLFLPAAQRADKEAMSGFAFLFSVGALQSQIRKLYRDTKDEEFDLESFVVEALSNSSILGIYTLGIDAMTAAGILAENGGARYDPMNGLPSLIFGPGVVGFGDRALNIMGRIRRNLTEEDSQFDYKDFNYMASTAVPMYKWLPIASVLKPTMKNYFESIGRGE